MPSTHLFLMSPCAQGGQFEQALTPPHRVRETGMIAYMLSYVAISECETAVQWEQDLSMRKEPSSERKH